MSYMFRESSPPGYPQAPLAPARLQRQQHVLTEPDGPAEPMVNLAAWIPCTEVEGPGKRFALWTQGCLLRCPGCCNPHMFALAPRQIVPVATLVEWIVQAKREFQIQGITLLGGEPVLQARGLALVARQCRRLDLSVMLFTGYYLEELQESRFPGVDELLSCCDVVVAGPYLQQLPETTRNWVGSTNQRFHYLTDRYGPEIETDPRFRPAIEIRFRPQGLTLWNGWPVLASGKNKGTSGPGAAETQTPKGPLPR